PKISMLTTQSKIRFTMNRESPRCNPVISAPNEGKRVTVERIPPPRQDNARSRSTLPCEGSLNNEEYRSATLSID
ncbi:hypothetical protein KAT21_01570, partial [Candidatus Bathyarchaeota archaeon]|nr:hypothetical protein [Candidatus Bathyarchaeota archaeon]